MGASVIGFWPGITQEQLENQPGFYNDCNAWGNWMAQVQTHPALLKLHQSLDVQPLLSHTTDGIKPSQVHWVSPRDLASAATRLRDLVLARDPRIEPFLHAYALHSNHVDPTDQEFAQDLWDVAAIAQFADKSGAKQMTMEVNW